MKTLTQSQIRDALYNLPDWSQNEDVISKEFIFAEFAEAIMFVNRVAELAEDADHHPDIDIRFNKVTLALSTHSAGGLTHKDIELAQQIEELLSQDADYDS